VRGHRLRQRATQRSAIVAGSPWAICDSGAARSRGLWAPRVRRSDTVGAVGRRIGEHAAATVAVPQPDPIAVAILPARAAVDFVGDESHTMAEPALALRLVSVAQTQTRRRRPSATRPSRPTIHAAGAGGVERQPQPSSTSV
jgi:hypothetical protein